MKNLTFELLFPRVTFLKYTIFLLLFAFLLSSCGNNSSNSNSGSQSRRLSIVDMTASESDGSIDFRVVLSEPYQHGDVVFDYHTISGSANNHKIWKQATDDAAWNKRSSHSSVVFDDKIWVLGGNTENIYKNDTWYSEDGENWKLATASADWDKRYSHSSVVFDNKIWVLGGFYIKDSRYPITKKDVWYSEDGENWQLATASADWNTRAFHSSVVFDDKIWVLGGYGDGHKNDIWYSEDGENWKLATASADWNKRNSHSSVVFDDKIWVLGGYDSKNYKNDVWYSEDGENWKLATASADWYKRNSHSSVVFDNKIWVLGGYGGGDDHKNDVWYSEDGKSWKLATISAEWDKRNSHSSVVFDANGGEDQKIWVLGGTGSDFKRDVHFLSIIQTDYQNINKKTVSIANGELEITISIKIIADATDESDKTFDVLISSPVNATIEKARATGTITDN